MSLLSYFTSKKSKDVSPPITESNVLVDDELQSLPINNSDLVGGIRESPAKECSITNNIDSKSSDEQILTENVPCPSPSMKGNKRSSAVSDVNHMTSSPRISPRSQQKAKQSFQMQSNISSSDKNSIVVTDLTTEVDALINTLNSLQKLLVSSQGYNEKYRSEFTELKVAYDNERKTQDEAYKFELYALKEECDTQILQANKIFVSKMSRLQQRCADAENQSKALLASTEAANKAANSVRTQRDEANLALAKSKIEILTLQKKISDSSVKNQRIVPLSVDEDLTCSLYAMTLESETGSPSPGSSFSPPLPSRMKPSTARPSTAVRVAPSSTGMVDKSVIEHTGDRTRGSQIAEWRRQVMQAYEPSEENSTIQEKQQQMVQEMQMYKGPYKVNNLHEIPFPTEGNGHPKYQKLSIQPEMFKNLKPSQKAAIRPVSSVGQRKGVEAVTKARAISAGEKITEYVEKPKLKSKPAAEPSKTMIEMEREEGIDIEKKLISYEDDLSDIAAANCKLVAALKSSNKMLTLLYKENEQFAEEISSLYRNKLAIGFKTSIRSANIQTSATRTAVAGKKKETQQKVFEKSINLDENYEKLLTGSLQFYDEAIGRILESHSHLLAALSASLHGNVVGKKEDDVLTELVSSCNDLQSILSKSKQTAHTNQLKLLTLTKQKQDTESRLYTTESNLEMLQKELASLRNEEISAVNQRKYYQNKQSNQFNEVTQALMEAIENLSTIEILIDSHVDKEAVSVQANRKMSRIPNHVLPGDTLSTDVRTSSTSGKICAPLDNFSIETPSRGSNASKVLSYSDNRDVGLYSPFPVKRETKGVDFVSPSPLSSSLGVSFEPVLLSSIQ